MLSCCNFLAVIKVGESERERAPLAFVGQHLTFGGSGVGV